MSVQTWTALNEIAKCRNLTAFHFLHAGCRFILWLNNVSKLNINLVYVMRFVWSKRKCQENVLLYWILYISTNVTICLSSHRIFQISFGPSMCVVVYYPGRTGRRCRMTWALWLLPLDSPSSAFTVIRSPEDTMTSAPAITRLRRAARREGRTCMLISHLHTNLHTYSGAT